MQRRLRLAKIERKPKSVEFIPSYRDTIGLSKRPDLAQAVLAIRNAIEAGSELPAWAYRKRLRHTPDELLSTDGIMHLHLGSQDSRELLYLIQYSDHVLVLEISDHVHFSHKPPGHVLKVFHKRSINALEESKSIVMKFSLDTNYEGFELARSPKDRVQSRGRSKRRKPGGSP